VSGVFIAARSDLRLQIEGEEDQFTEFSEKAKLKWERFTTSFHADLREDLDR
jgi:hypothetical protein